MKIILLEDVKSVGKKENWWSSKRDMQGILLSPKAWRRGNRRQYEYSKAAKAQ